MKSIFPTIRSLRLAISLTAGLCLGNAVWSAPSIQSIDVSPNPLTNGQSFSIAVIASPDVIRASATVDFRLSQPSSLRIPLALQGGTWIGSGIVPSEVRRQLPNEAGAKVKVAVFDAAGVRAVGVAQMGLEIVSISAVFADGVLTVTGDDHSNTLIVGRDAAGTILINGGAVPVTGGVPTIANTTLIRILGLGGNDVLLADEANGPMPPANLLGGEGDDTLTGGANADELEGGPGDDTLLGRDGNDHLVGGPGDDILSGDRGVDGHFGGKGDDRLVWNPGDGSDLIEGEEGNDALDFFGANNGEIVDLNANGQRLHFLRNPGSITMDCDGIERVIFHALSGSDQVNVNELTGTQVTNVLVDLSGPPGSGDLLADTIAVNGTGTNDLITVLGSTNEVHVLGLSAVVTIVGVDQGLDQLVINALGGDDMVDASRVQAGAIELTLNGGVGTDMLLGGAGNDLLVGAQGIDFGFGGAGDDTFVWNPGDASDVFEGEAGQDTMLFNGANATEQVDLSAVGPRLRFFRSPGNITMDCHEVESIQFNAFSGADMVNVNDLTGTGVTNVNLNLALLTGQGDNEADTVIINGTAGNDVAAVTGTPAGVTVAGLPAAVNIVGGEQALDQLVLRLLAGDDVAEASGLLDGLIKLTVEGGQGSDVLFGSPGADTLRGDEGDDVLQGGPGLDLLDGGPGDNVVIQD